MDNKKQDNLSLFLLMMALLLGYFWLGNYLWPPPKPQVPDPPEAEVAEGKDKPEVRPPAPGPAENIAAPVDEPGDDTAVVLGGPGWHLDVTLTPRGAGVRRLVFNDFQQADAYGRPVWADEKNRIKQPLEFIPDSDTASYVLRHFETPRSDEEPQAFLGRRRWKRVEPAEVEPNKKYNRAVFETTLDGVKIVKTFTLEPRSYHIGLSVRLELDKNASREREFRYELSGGHDLPIEGQWYGSTLRHALVASVNQRNEVKRFYQDQREISQKGGNLFVPEGDGTLRYAGTAVQFFASVIAVDPRQAETLQVIDQARARVLRSAVRGSILNDPATDGVLKINGPDGKELKLSITQELLAEQPELIKRFSDVVVVYRRGTDKDTTATPVVAVYPGHGTVGMFHEDFTTSVNSFRGLSLKPGVPVTHTYVLYNGPVKTKLLSQLHLDEPVDDLPRGAPAVDADLVRFYLDDLHLNTLTDYHSPGWISEKLAATPWTPAIIFFTNLCHDILYYLSQVLPYGLAIVMLTVLVRGIMHPLSRKQAKMSIKMQEMAPELQKLKEKYPDPKDKQALSMEMMALYRKHGVNPLGSCWMIFLQMPVFMGLYYALQESIHFRLAPFLWIENLAAPDMLIRWGESIPYLTQAQSWGGFFYLGPYFNLLPIIAVGFMVVQQKMTMPPPTDEQQEMQMKMMKYMMIFMGLMFYKVAAGLAIYFIASSLWGFAERKLLPKKKVIPDGAVSEAENSVLRTSTAQLTTRLETPLNSNKGKKSRAKERNRGATNGTPDHSESLMERAKRLWDEMLRQAKKK